ncbi:Cullin-domain-containing protein [Rozella allomycis CSF55]|uniref:Cullin CUL3-like protein n=1 Tax=Rozella allomycis (strain CSF55) TaxID=988480 RepID=A0A075ANZ9_ROZAC|nr:Cullin CUL3-like protein [Rozella allomycis CSF55]RKP21112.1 Cullin-domain-containing protein [Rozella allomycis CSF55]|eukprot:EPZ31707.1 Cullin CUL3-like protein [Rozella allomycis CSF55]
MSEAEVFYGKIEEYFMLKCSEIGARIEIFQGYQYLAHLSKEWQNFKLSVSMVSDVCLYMNNGYCRQRRIRETMELALDCFKETVISNQLTKINGSLIEEINKERNGNIIERDTLSKIFTMMNELESIDYDYFMEKTRDYFVQEQEILMKFDDTKMYLAKVKARLEGEQERIVMFFPEISQKNFIDLVYDIFIKQPSSKICELNGGISKRLAHKDYECLTLFYNLFNPCGCMEVLNSYVRTFIVNFTAEKSNWMNEMINFYEYLSFVQIECFVNNKDIWKCMNQAFGDCIKNESNACSHLISYLDKIFRENIEEFENIFDKLIIIFRFIPDKDVFDLLFRKLLAKQLIQRKDISLIQSFVVRLKSECGLQYTQKMEGMINDAALSADYKEKSLQPIILTTSFWPLKSTKSSINLPLKLKEQLDVFEKSYLLKHNGRRLNWQFNLGQADLVINFLESRHEVNVSTIQMFILLLFQEAETLNADQISKSLNITLHEMERHILSLALGRFKILQKTPGDNFLRNSDIFTFNNSFKHKAFKFKVPLLQIKPSNSEVPNAEHSIEQVEEDRRYQYPFCCLLVLSYNMFHPEPSVIKKRIENLIEKEFIERDEENKYQTLNILNRQFYKYLA